MALTPIRYTASSQTATTANVEKVIYTVPAGKISKIIFKPVLYGNDLLHSAGGDKTSSTYKGNVVYSDRTNAGMEMRVGGEVILATGNGVWNTLQANTSVFLNITSEGLHTVTKNTTSYNLVALPIRTRENGLLLLEGETITFKTMAVGYTKFSYDFIVLEEDL